MQIASRKSSNPDPFCCKVPGFFLSFIHPLAILADLPTWLFKSSILTGRKIERHTFEEQACKKY